MDFICCLLFKNMKKINLIMMLFLMICFRIKGETGQSKPAGQFIWKFKTGARLFASPVAGNGKVYIGGEDHQVYAIAAKTGKEIWRFETGGAVNSSPVLAGETIFVSSADGLLYALHAGTGKLKWKFRTQGERKIGFKGLWGMLPADLYMEDPYDFFISSPVVQQNGKTSLVYFGSGDGYLYALNASSGVLKWKFKTAGVIRSTPVLAQHKVYVGSWDTYFYALDQESGRLIWKFKTGEDQKLHLMEGFQASALVKDKMVYVGCRDGFFYALDAEQGSLKWKYNAKGSWIISTAAAGEGMVYTTTSDSYLFLALEAATGIEKYRIKTSGYNFSSPVLAGGQAFFGDFSGQLYAVDLAKGNINGIFETTARKLFKKDVLDEKYKLNFKYSAGGKDPMLYQTTLDVMKEFYKLGPIIAAPVIAGKMVYVSSTDGYLYALKY